MPDLGGYTSRLEISLKGQHPMDSEPQKFLLHERFEECARRVPDHPALFEGDQSISYAELNSRVEKVAEGLRSQGLGSGASVGLFLERSIDWVVGILAILKINASVVPLTPSNPVEWLRDILAFSKLEAVIDTIHAPVDPSIPARTIHMSVLAGREPESESEPFSPGRPEQPAFVLCSSGSTGRPKMIVRSHRSFSHRLEWTWKEHPFQGGEVACQKAHMTTTHSIYELFEALLMGTPTVIVPDQDVRNLETFWDTIRERGITRLLLVPSALRASLDMPDFEPPALRVLVLMGEYLSPGLAERTVAAFSQETSLYTIYGSTEASSTLVCNLRQHLVPGEELPLGLPLSPEVEPLVLDSDLAPVPRGEAGRLHMGGISLFTEYFRDPALTASAFVDKHDYGGPLFDTNDRVRVTPEGDLRFLGRSDDTVKIRGFRVDLPEVERVILEHPDVGQASVQVSEEGTGGNSLVAFVLPADVDRPSLYQHLRARLPGYMVPSVILALDAFPLTASSKVDRAGLLDLYHAHAATSGTGDHLSDTERLVRKAWEEILGQGQFSEADSFFEVGGTSLTVFALVARLRRDFGLEREQLGEDAVYRSSTVSELATSIDLLLAGEPEETSGSAPLLVTLRRGTDPTRHPLFLVASAGGTLGAYEKLSKALETPREIIGVRDPFTWGGRDPTEGFQRWIASYVEAIRQRQPTGPYHLGAYSSAGAFGLEVAQHLRRAGEDVSILVLIDPLALDRRDRSRYGHWALRATWMRSPTRMMVRLAGWIRAPFLGLRGTSGARAIENNLTLTAEKVEGVTKGSHEGKGHLMNVAALLELNTGLPFTLSEEDFRGKDPEEHLAVFLSKVEALTPNVDPETMKRILVQYNLQLSAQHAYQLQTYDGRVLLVEPSTRYSGLLKALFRPHVKNLQVRKVALAPPSGRTQAISDRFGALEAHYRSMRDDQFVKGLAAEMDRVL